MIFSYLVRVGLVITKCLPIAYVVIIFYVIKNLFKDTISCLIGFQQLFGLNVATQRCRRRDNWKTRGSSFLVLSYEGKILSIYIESQIC